MNLRVGSRTQASFQWVKYQKKNCSLSRVSLFDLKKTDLQFYQVLMITPTVLILAVCRMPVNLNSDVKMTLLSMTVFS